MAKSIWQTLGIKKTSDVGAIKRAYAAKIKVFRPDENPVEFQTLREARDSAEAWARSNAVQLDPTDYTKSKNDEADVVTKSESVPNISSKSRKRTRRKEKSKVIDVIETAVAPDPVSPLLNWFKAEGPEPGDNEIRTAMSRIRNLELGERYELENHLLYAISANFDIRLDPARVVEMPFPVAASTKADNLILDLGEEFGWLDNDRRLAEGLWDAGQLSDRLHSLRDFGTLTPPRNYGVINTTSSWDFSRAWMIVVWLILIGTIKSCSDRSHERDFWRSLDNKQTEKPLIDL